MVQQTLLFHLQTELQDIKLCSTAIQPSTDLHMSEDELRAELNRILSDITTLEEYATLVQILHKLRYYITLRFLALLFEALVDVEKRIWGTQGLTPPLDDIYNDYCDLLLDDYSQFIYLYEKAIIDWTKQNGFFSDPKYYSFIKERNDIYANYAILAKEIIEGD